MVEVNGAKERNKRTFLPVRSVYRDVKLTQSVWDSISIPHSRVSCGADSLETINLNMVSQEGGSIVKNQQVTSVLL